VIARRLFLLLAAATALAACAGVCVIALALALGAWVEPMVGAAGAAAIVAAAAALILALGALILALGARARRRRLSPPGSSGLVERALALMRDKPVVAIVAAVGAGLLAIRNPRYLGAALRSFAEGRELPRR